MKKLSTLACVAVVLVSIPAAAATFLAHNTQISWKDSQSWVSGYCSGVYQHGNVYGAAYSKIKRTGGSYCEYVSTEVTGYNGSWVTDSNGGSSSNVWYQATAYYSNIVGSKRSSTWRSGTQYYSKTTEYSGI